MKQWLRRLAGCLVLSLILLAAWPMVKRWRWGPQSADVATAVDAGPTVDKIVGLSSLTTLRVDVADAVESELPGRTGSVRAVLIVKGDVTLGVDLSGAVFEQVDQQVRTAALVLPPPRVQSVRLDQEHTKLLGVWESGLWIIVPGGSDADTAAVNHALRDAQRMVAAAGNDPDLVPRCKAQTQQVLAAFFAAMGWRVMVRWRA